MLDIIKVNSRDAARTLLKAAEVIQPLEAIGVLADERFLNEVRACLAEIADLPINDSANPLHTRIGRYHIKLKKSLWETAVAGTVAVIVALEPTQLTKGAAIAQIIRYLGSLRNFLTKLDDAEIEVYEAISAIVRDKKDDGKVLEIKEASKVEISEILHRGGRTIPKNLEDILSSLIAKGGITPVFHGSESTFYSTVF